MGISSANSIQADVLVNASSKAIRKEFIRFGRLLFAQFNKQPSEEHLFRGKKAPVNKFSS